MLLGILTNLVACSSGFYGWRPDQVRVDLPKAQGDPYFEYVRVREFAIQMTESYDSRAGFNRGSIYAGSAAVLGLTMASSGLAAFGAAASAAGKSLPLASTFLNGLFSIFDSHQLAQTYTTEANKLRRVVSESDTAFLQAPTMSEKASKVTELQERVLDIVSEVEEARNNALPDTKKAVERAVRARDEVEEALSIKPKIESITPRVATQKEGTQVTILGTGFDSRTTILLSGTQVGLIFETEKRISFKTAKVDKVTAHSIVVRNRFDKEAGSPISFVQADLNVERCEKRVRSNDPTKPVVVLVQGQGFQGSQEDGTIVFEANVKVVATTWQAHSQWEVQLDNSDPSTAITVTKVEVKNPRDGTTKAILQLNTCQVPSM